MKCDEIEPADGPTRLTTVIVDPARPDDRATVSPSAAGI